MKHLLKQIRKFFKRLESGQMELEAGQWELHKKISYLKTSISALEQLKLELQQMKNQGLKQTCLIKKLQSKLNVLEEIRKNGKDNDHWSALSSNHEYKNGRDAMNGCEEMPKTTQKKIHSKTAILNSEDNIEHESQGFISLSESFIKLRPEREIDLSKNKRKKVQDELKPLKNCSISKSSINILQRYLKDVTNKSSNKMSKKLSTKSNYKKSKRRKSLDDLLKIQMEVESKPFIFLKSETSSTSTEKYNRIMNSKKSKYKDDYASCKKIHSNKSLYSCSVCKKIMFCKKNLEKCKKFNKKSKNMSNSFRGFRCSYCDKICRTPDKLTKHIEKCRIITRINSYKK